MSMMELEQRDVNREYRQMRMARIRSGAGGFHGKPPKALRRKEKVQLRKEWKEYR